ncbi:hypothetical protein GOB94_00025 [Granulicella sp. 5B5]|uniref:hypothetical protein n=1 Tax=Granulicella sp. 5B5 TaxID=1617967 RepID=UPI0015F5E8E7|nr:hypothetical protein [Granulicella sp. 5B5]QMV17272.1 hypothetical protein GOB94_00025 [Granulicella sp. 5B5]
MKRICFLVICVLAMPLSGASAQTKAKSRPLTSAEIQSVERAIQDEIYDYDYFRSFYQIGENIGTPEHWISRLHVYINPAYDAADGHGVVIYKLMPYGQVYRLFFLGSKNGVQLDGDPQNKFPITQPSRLTVYMDEDEVCRDERTWTKSFFNIDTAATPAIIEAASKRQKARTGFSYWEHEHEPDNAPK